MITDSFKYMLHKSLEIVKLTHTFVHLFLLFKRKKKVLSYSEALTENSRKWTSFDPVWHTLLVIANRTNNIEISSLCKEVMRQAKIHGIDKCRLGLKCSTYEIFNPDWKKANKMPWNYTSKIRVCTIRILLLNPATILQTYAY